MYGPQNTQQCVGSAMEAGMTAAVTARAVLPPCAAVVGTKTPAATTMAGAQTTTNNQLKATATMVTETATMTVTMMTMKTKATVVAVAAAWQECNGGSGSTPVAEYYWAIRILG